jgi:hypothetical protein
MFSNFDLQDYVEHKQISVDWVYFWRSKYFGSERQKHKLFLHFMQLQSENEKLRKQNETFCFIFVAWALIASGIVAEGAAAGAPP